MKGPLIILSGPSGSGKSTIISRLKAIPELRLRQSISATTRSPRSGERDGQDYYFLSPEEFEAKRSAGEFLEWATVHGHHYGTPRGPIDQLREEGHPVVLVIDVQGAAQVRRSCPDAVSIFLTTSSLDVLEKRLRDRQTEDERSIRRRLENARIEIEHASEFTERVLNDDLETAVQHVRRIIIDQLRKGDANAR